MWLVYTANTLGGAWSGWTSLGGAIASNISVGTNSDGRLQSLLGLLIIQSYITRKPHQEVPGPAGVLLEAERLAIPL